MEVDTNNSTKNMYMKLYNFFEVSKKCFWFWNSETIIYYNVQVIHISKVRFFKVTTNWHKILRQPAFTLIFKIALFNSSTESKEVAIVFHLLRKFITGQLCGKNGVQMAKHQSIKFSRSKKKKKKRKAERYFIFILKTIFFQKIFPWSI